MEDSGILELYWARDEQAIRETDAAYGSRLQQLAARIAGSCEDAQECVSDTYLRAWNTIPPQRPVHFFAYLAKICRNIALDRLDRNRAAKRSAQVVSLSDELERCIPAPQPGCPLEREELGQLLNRFLEGLPRESRMFFLRRYFFADSIAQIAGRYGVGESKVKTSLHRTREKLRIFLKSEGIEP